jgi:hypothetical protein
MVHKRVLYFIRIGSPTEAENEAALRLGTLTFRSLEAYHDSDFIEECDAVAGLAPEAYRKRFPYLEDIKPPEPSAPPEPLVPNPTVPNPSPPWKNN